MAPSAMGKMNLRLTFEIFHNIKKAIVYVWLVCELNLDLVKITKRVLFHLVSSLRFESNKQN
jgi:hypothetical protein